MMRKAMRQQKYKKQPTAPHRIRNTNAGIRPPSTIGYLSPRLNSE